MVEHVQSVIAFFADAAVPASSDFPTSDDDARTFLHDEQSPFSRPPLCFEHDICCPKAHQHIFSFH